MASEALITVGVVAALWAVGSVSGGDSDATGDEYGAKDACHTWVKERLKSPSTAEFIGDSVTGDRSGWTITGQVDSENGFGAMLRSSWTCKIRLNGDMYRGHVGVFE